MPKVRKVYVVFAIALLVFSIPIIAFNKTTYALPGWETLKETVCGSSDTASNYDATKTAQKNGCIAGIGMTDTFCNTGLGMMASSEAINACKYGVLKSNINGMILATRIRFIQENCGRIGGDDTVMRKRYYQCQGDSDWKNEQGYCDIDHKLDSTSDPFNPPVLTSETTGASCYKYPYNKVPTDEPEDPDPGDGEEDGDPDDEDPGDEDETPGGNTGGSGSTSSGSIKAYSCEDGVDSVLAWLYCPQANLLTKFVDMIVNSFIVPLLQWRIMI